MFFLTSPRVSQHAPLSTVGVPHKAGIVVVGSSAWQAIGARSTMAKIDNRTGSSLVIASQATRCASLKACESIGVGLRRPPVGWVEPLRNPSPCRATSMLTPMTQRRDGYRCAQPILRAGLERKPGKTPPSKWPDLPPNLAGKKSKWNPEGYWQCPGNRDLTWDDRTHGAGIDRGQGPQGGHWDDENSGNRWDENGNPLPGSPEYQFADPSGSPKSAPWYAPPPWLAPLGAAGTIIWLLILAPK